MFAFQSDLGDPGHNIPSASFSSAYLIYSVDKHHKYQKRG